MALRHLALSGLALGAGLGLLAGCGRGGEPSGLKGAAGYGLYYNDAGATASLAYGQANSDNVALMLECAKRSGRVQVSDAVRGGSTSRMVLAAGGARTTLPARIEAGDGPPLLIAEAASADPALDGFRRTGRIDVAYGDVRYAVSAVRDEQQNVKRFFTACDRT